MKLFAPNSYRAAQPEEKEKIVNGCGPGGWKFDLVPDTLWGLKVTKACNIHDWMYHFGQTLDDKKKADRVFLNNMLRLIDAKTKWRIVRRLRRRRARIYYEAVKRYGAPSFWSNKNKPDELLSA
jgi:uncharacterized protein DUF1353